jgi:large conductance mechanosensitive channel
VFGEPNFDELLLSVGDGAVAYGRFLTALVNFLLVAFGLFLIVKLANRLHRKPEETPTTRPCPYCLTQIPREATRCSACTSEVEATAA